MEKKKLSKEIELVAKLIAVGLTQEEMYELFLIRENMVLKRVLG